MPAAIRGRSTTWWPSATCAPSRTIRSPRRTAGWWKRPAIRRKAACMTSTAPPKAPGPTANRMSVGKSGGFTYLLVLIFVAAVGVGLAGIGELTSHADQREKEVELL